MRTTLEQVPIGSDWAITAIDDPQIALMALRLGIQAGQRVILTARVPGGPSVIRCGEQEIALGRAICQGIEVSRVVADIALGDGE